jgi:hypothetical protein
MFEGVELVYRYGVRQARQSLTVAVNGLLVVDDVGVDEQDVPRVGDVLDFEGIVRAYAQ